MSDTDRDKAHAVCREIEANLRVMGLITTAHYEAGIPPIAEAIAEAREEGRAEADRLRALCGRARDLFALGVGAATAGLSEEMRPQWEALTADARAILGELSLAANPADGKSTP